MRLRSHLGEVMNYKSTLTIESSTYPEVRYTIRRMSFGRRLELTSRIRELGGRMRRLDAGEDLSDRVESALLSHEVERLYLEWGLEEVQGIEIDGLEATPELLIEAGPEALVREIVAQIQAECSLSEDERKN